MKTGKMAIRDRLTPLTLRPPTAESSLHTSIRRKRGSGIRPLMLILRSTPHPRPRRFERKTERTRASTSPPEKVLELEGI